MIINYLNKVFMKSKKVMESRKAPPSRLIVDEYDLIKKQEQQQHSFCAFCKCHLPQSLLTAHQNVCMMKQNHQYYTRTKSQNQFRPTQHSENHRKKICSKFNKLDKKKLKTQSTHQTHKNKNHQYKDFIANPSTLSQKSTIKNKKKQKNSSSYLKCNSFRRISNQSPKKTLNTNQSVRIDLSKSKRQQKLRKKTFNIKERYPPQQLKNYEKKKSQLSSKGKRITEVEKRQQKRDGKLRKQRQQKKRKEREKQRKQKERRNRQSEGRRNNRNPRSRNAPQRQQNEQFSTNFSQIPNQAFELISQAMNEQVSMLRQQFQQLSPIFNSFQGIQSNSNGFVLYSNISENSGEIIYYEQGQSEEEEENGLVQEEIDLIPQFKYKKRQGGEQQCTVCLNGLKMNETVKSLPCQHVFHSDCIDEWLARKAICPVCRENIKNLL